MVHGSCSSRGCFAMTDEAIAEVYAIAREAFAGGQRTFQFQSYPFRMTPQNLAQHRFDPHMPFWQNLKEGSDYFEAVREEPKVGVCGRRYVFGGADVAQGNCSPEVEPAVAEKSGATSSRWRSSSPRERRRSGSSTTTAASTRASARPSAIRTTASRSWWRPARRTASAT